MPSRYVSAIGNSTIEIIDCPHADQDLQTGITAYNHLLDLTPGRVPRVRRHGIESERAFWECLDLIERECVQGWKPIIHIEGHASESGLELRRGLEASYPVVPWAVLVDRFRRINVASGFNLGIFVAACEGIEALRPMNFKKAAPYMFLVAPEVVVRADVVRAPAEGFYQIIVTAPDLNRACASLPTGFRTFLAERFLATTYARVLKAQSFGRNRKERVNALVNSVVPDNAPTEQVRSVRDMAKVFSRPDRDRFEAARRVYLPAGTGFSFDDLVEYARTGRSPG